MKIWYLWRDFGKAGYDEAYGFVVIAETEQQARDLVANNRCDGFGDEGSVVWHTTAHCEELTAVGEPRIVLRDYLAG